MTLKSIAPHTGEHGCDFFGFHSFRGYFHVEPCCQTEAGFDNGCRRLRLWKRKAKRLVDLQFRKRQAGEPAQRRMSCSEIIDRQAEPGKPQPHDLAQSLVVETEDSRLAQLENYPVPSDAGSCALLNQPFSKALGNRVGAEEVDQDRQFIVVGKTCHELERALDNQVRERCRQIFVGHQLIQVFRGKAIRCPPSTRASASKPFSVRPSEWKIGW